MPQFAYKAIQHDGVLTEGFLDASNRQEAMRQVEGRGAPRDAPADHCDVGPTLARKRSPRLRWTGRSGGSVVGGSRWIREAQ